MNRRHFLLYPSLLFAIGMLFIANSCQKKDALPAPTTEGLNTFACKINGKNWIANGIPTGNKALEVCSVLETGLGTTWAKDPLSIVRCSFSLATRALQAVMNWRLAISVTQAELVTTRYSPMME